jgi:hypothetical protein
VGTFIHHLPRHVKLLMNIVPCMLSVAVATICDLQLPVLVESRNCTTTDKVILTLQLCKLPRCGGVALHTSGHAEMLLNNYRVSAVLQVEQTSGILSHRSHAHLIWSRGLIRPQNTAATQDLPSSKTERARAASRQCQQGGSHTVKRGRSVPCY